MRIRIVIQTQYYPPEMGAPQARLSELAKLLVEHGIEVTVLTAMPNYPRGEIYEGYGGLLQKETVDGVRIIRTAIFPTQSAGLFPRLANYFSFVLSSLLLGGWYISKADYLLTESPPLFLGIAGFILSRWKRAKWIFNVSDLWPESAKRLGVLSDGWALRLSYALERFCYDKAFAVTGQSKTILTNILERYPDTRCFHLSNGVDSSRFEHQLAHSKGHVRKELAAVYAGLHGLAQGLDQILLAAKDLQDANLRFVFVGDGPQKRSLVERAQSLGLNNVEFRNPIAREEIPALLTSADIALVPLKIYLPGAVPSKIYEAMAAGLPIILVAEGEAAEIVTSYRAGVVVKPGQIDRLVEAVRCLAENPEQRLAMGMAGRQAAEEVFDRRIVVDRFVDFLEDNIDADL